MKKIFTLAAAVLASFSLWAAEPNLAINTESQGTEDFVKAYEAEGITLSSSASFSSGVVQLGNTPSSYDQHYFEVLAGSAEIDSISFLISGNGSNKNIQAPLFGWAETATSNTADTYVLLDPKVVTANSYAAAQWFTYDLSKAKVKCARIYRATKNVSSADPEYTGSSTALGTAQTIKIYGLKVWLKETKEVDHVVETLTGAAINGVALDETEMSTLLNNGEFEDPDYYVEAPTVTFTVQTDTYYVGEETPSTKSENIDVVAALNPDGKWQAQQTVGEQTYTITAVKPATATVTYMDGETVLGTEIVKVGESATKHGEYEVKPLAEFQGWYTNAELTSEADLTAAVNADKTLYGKFVKAYAQSLNIEQLVVTNGKSYGIKDALIAAGYEYSNLDALDSLNNEKGAARNEPYLGLKIKTQGGFIACNVATGSTIRVKFGYVENDVLAIAGNDTITLTPANKTLNVLEFTAAADTYVKIQTTSGKTVVIKQIMVNEAIANVMYKITYAEAEHGTVSGWTIAFPNEEVELSFTMDEGYTVASCYANDVEIVGIPEVGEFFTMPAENVTITATFADAATAIDNTNAETKAVKVIRNGQLIIVRDGVEFNAQGAIVK